ncbi:MAG: GtrA family protein [Candidatus Saccharimonadaceae bacterium]
MRLIKFLISGSLAALVEFCLFILFHNLYGPNSLVLAQTLSFLAGFVVSFSLNKLWVFKSDAPLTQELFRYIVLVVINLIITNLLIGVLVQDIGLTYWIAKIILMILVATWNYVLFQKLIFNKKTNKI